MHISTNPLMTLLNSFVLYTYAIVSTILIETYRGSLYFYVNFPTLSSILGTLILIYLVYKSTRYFIRLIYSLVIALIKFVLLLNLLILGLWCYIRGFENFYNDVRFIGLLIYDRYSEIRHEAGDIIDELDGDSPGYQFNVKDFDLNFNFFDLTRNVRAQNVNQLVELFGLNLVQFYRIATGGVYGIINSDTIRGYFNGVADEFNRQYRDL